MSANAPLRLNLPVLAIIAVLPVFGQILLLSSFSKLSGAEVSWMVFSVVAYSALLAAGAAAIGGIVARKGAGWVPALVWILLVGGAALYLVDYFSYAWLRLHLHETIPLLVENIPSFKTTMRSKLAALILAAGLLAAFLIAGTAVLRYAMARVGCFAKPVRPSRVLMVAGTLAVLVVVDRAASPYVLGMDAYEAKSQVLWQTGLYTPSHPLAPLHPFEIDAPQFRQIIGEDAVGAALSGLAPADVARPRNVFFFMVDSLRADVITEDVAPNLYALQQRAVPVKAGVAASNVTHMSWFSLLHGVNPLYWSVAAHEAHSPGSIPMRVLSRCGYRITAYSCSSLEYFGFERSVFGDSPRLASKVLDARTLFDRNTDRNEGDVDEKLMAQLNTDLDTLRGDSRAFYLLVLDSTHHDYSWARRYQPKFVPYEENVSVFSTPREEQIGPLKNRYLNAVNYVDMLMGEFLQKLEARGLMDDSIIVVTGDHGEEFYERLHLTHSSELNRFQVRTPIMFVMPGASDAPARAVASHMDIFPTIFAALGIKEKTAGLLEGTSLLDPDSGQPAFCAMSSNYTPGQMLLDDGDMKVIVDFAGVRKVGRTVFARKLTATKVLNGNDEVVTPGAPGNPTADEIRTRFLPTLRALLE